MTRGRIFFVEQDKVYVTLEFNGDMYYFDNGHGRKVIGAFLNHEVQDLHGFVDYVSKFDRENFGYQGYCAGVVYSINMDQNKSMDIRDYSSDYLYIINRNKEDLTLQCKDKDMICPGGGLAIVHCSNSDKIVTYEMSYKEAVGD